MLSETCSSWVFCSFSYIEPSDLGVNLLEHPLLRKQWHSVNTHLNLVIYN